MEKYDIIIVGGACAGLSAAIYGGRRALKTLVITKDIGGQIATTTEVENYPGTGTLMGPELAQAFRQQAEDSGAEIKFGEVTKIEKQSDVFSIATSIGDFEAPVVILAFGLEHRKLNVPGEKEFTGKGVSYCATCDGPLFKGKTVGIVGGGNSALDAAEYLSNLAEKVYMFIMDDTYYNPEKALVEAVEKAENVEVMFQTKVKEIIGDQFVEKVEIFNIHTDESSEVELNGLFVEIGWVAKTEFLKGLVAMNEKGFIVVNNKNETSLPGLYAAGDVTDTPYKQAVISAGEVAKAAIAASQYLQQQQGAKVVSTVPDWTKRKDKK
jgi:thioredoxin reductase (NADPH)